jgi:hypothetical protein
MIHVILKLVIGVKYSVYGISHYNMWKCLSKIKFKLTAHQLHLNHIKQNPNLRFLYLRSYHIFVLYHIVLAKIPYK